MEGIGMAECGGCGMKSQRVFLPKLAFVLVFTCKRWSLFCWGFDVTKIPAGGTMCLWTLCARTELLRSISLHRVNGRHLLTWEKVKEVHSGNHWVGGLAHFLTPSCWVSRLLYLCRQFLACIDMPNPNVKPCKLVAITMSWFMEFCPACGFFPWLTSHPKPNPRTRRSIGWISFALGLELLGWTRLDSASAAYTFASRIVNLDRYNKMSSISGKQWHLEKKSSQ